MSPINDEYLNDLRQILLSHFPPDAVARLCLDLDIDYAALEQDKNAASTTPRALEMARRSLAILERQAAAHTSLSIPVSLQIELEDKRQEVARLEGAGSGTPEHKVAALLTELAAQGRIPDLVAAGRRARPDLDWGDDAPAPPTLWSRALALPPAAPPIWLDGVLLVATQSRPPVDQRARICGLDAASGEVLWATDFEQGVVMGLSELPEQGRAVLSLASADMLHGAVRILAIDGAGRQAWSVTPGGLRVSGAAVCGGRVIASVNATTLLALDAGSGQELARFDLPALAAMTPPAADAGALYIPCRGPTLLALDEKCAVHWRHDFPGEPAPGWMAVPPVIAETCVVCALTSGRTVALRRADGRVLWQADVGPAGKALSEPTVAGDRLYVGARDGVHALELATGREAWHHPTKHYVTARPVVRGNVIYAACRDHVIYALDATTGHPRWRFEAEHGLKVAPAVKGQTLACVDRVGSVSVVHLPAALRPPEAHPTPVLFQPRVAFADAFATLTLRVAARHPEKGYPVELRLDLSDRDEPVDTERRYMAPDDLPWEGGDDLDAVGRQLFLALVERSGHARTWGKMEGLASQRRIQLKIAGDAPELHRLPWELLRDTVPFATMFSANANTPFSRLMPSDVDWGEVIGGRALRILVLLSNPADLATRGLAPLALEDYRQGFDVLNEAGPFRFKVLDGPVTRSCLVQTLRRERYHGLHFVGHGAFNEARQEAALYFQHEDGSARRIAGSDLCESLASLHHHNRPRMIFLAACHSAATSLSNPFVGLGPMLGRVGVPVVVAMQDAVQMRAARHLTRVFYRQLMAHGVVDRAMNEARGALDAMDYPSAAVAILFMRLKSGRLWQPT